MTFSENISIKPEEATENYELIVIHKDKENTSSLQVGPVPTAQRPPKIQLQSKSPLAFKGSEQQKSTSKPLPDKSPKTVSAVLAEL